MHVPVCCDATCYIWSHHGDRLFHDVLTSRS